MASSKKANLNEKTSFNETSLDLAVARGKYKIVKLLINKGGGTKSYKNKANPLHKKAIKAPSNSQKLFKYLSKNIVFDCRYKWNRDLFYYAIREGKLGIVKYMVKNGANVNQTERKIQSPIGIATEADKVKIIKFLLSKGADINYRYWDGDTVLHRGVRTGNLNCVKTLIEHGADMFPVEIGDPYSFQKAAFRGYLKKQSDQYKCIEYINNKKEIIYNKEIDEFEKKVKGIKQYKQIVRFVSVKKGVVIDKKTGLMWADRTNKYGIKWDDAVKFCKNYRAGGYTDWRLPSLQEIEILHTPESKNKNGVYVTPLIKISLPELWTYHHKIINGGKKRVLKYNINSNSIKWTKKQFGTFTKVLPVRGNMIVNLDYSNPLDELNHIEKNGITKLHWAATYGKLDMVKRLIKLGMSPNVLDKKGNTPLHRATKYQKHRIVSYLLKHGADPNAEDNLSDTPIILSAFRLDKKSTEILLKKEADINSNNDIDGTPLYIALSSGKKEEIIIDYVKLLLRYNSDVNYVYRGWTPASYAKKLGLNDTEKLLLEYIKKKRK